MIPKSHADGYVYFIGSDLGLIKIGTTVNLRERAYALANENAGRIQLLGFIEVDTRCMYKKESELHAQFKRFRRHSEWFKDVPSIRDYILENCNTNCSLVNDRLWAVYNTPIEVRNEIAAKMSKGSIKSGSERRIRVQEAIRSTLKSYPGCDVKTITQKIGYSRGLCWANLLKLEKSGIVSREIYQTGAQYRFQKTIWYSEESEMNDTNSTGAAV